MNLTPVQRRILEAYYRFHTEGFQFASLLRSWRQTLLVLGGCAVVTLLVILPMYPYIGCAFLGVFAGALLRDIGQFRAFAWLWPVLDRVIDWDKVIDLLAPKQE